MFVIIGISKDILMNSILRQVRYPLKLKLLTLMIVLIASSLIIFVGIALQIFREDKSAYIFETLLNKASSSQIILRQQLETVTAEGSFKVSSGKITFGEVDVKEILNKSLNSKSAYKLKIIVPKHNELYQWDGAVSKVSPTEEKIIIQALTQSLYQGVKEINLDKKPVLYAYDYDPKANFAFIVYLDQAKAYEATTYLINKSTYYGLFILGLSMLVSVLLARPLTSQLETLFGMTQELARGNFEKRVDLKGHDEVGALSDSINDMANKIVVYMDEMKEKARLENEVAVAQLVQSSFFPPEVELPDIYGYFEPATECGGDWWGFFDDGDWRVVFIADATGHGVPAALLTATMNCCKTSLSFILEGRPDFISKPHEILRFMNQAVHGAGKEIQVTCFVACLNRKTNELIYSNASHTPSLLFSSAKETLTKDSFRPLIDANGPRLGQKADSIFTSAKLELSVNDTIFLYTDGLTEADDEEGTRWGERRLLKSLGENGRGTPNEIIQGVLKDFKAYVKERPNSDDVTIVAMKVVK
jgi:sigma-B regulation protein RsbU (phosphoserine phosphatase)